MTQCFLLVPTDRVRLYLRVFTFGVYDTDREGYTREGERPGHAGCPAAEWRMSGEVLYRAGHESNLPSEGQRVRTRGVFVGEADAEWTGDEGQRTRALAVWWDDYEGDPRWPMHCVRCGEPFPEGAIRQVTQDLIYVRSDTGEETTTTEAPDGALWYADDCPERWTGPDGRTLVAKTPGGHEWIIDSVASNCDLPDDETHRCWMRHGSPPDITVDKEPEPPFDHTCSPGAGSIQVGSYHGFLTGGRFT